MLQVPKGHCWVEGDNGEISLDSKSFGPVSALMKLLLLRSSMGLVSQIWPYIFNTVAGKSTLVDRNSYPLMMVIDAQRIGICDADSLRFDERKGYSCSLATQ